MTKPIKIGTRGSPLALVQTELLADALRRHHPQLAAEGAIEVVTITTSGDRIQDRALSEAGGKGLFTKEIEEALLSGEIDCAVHSMKDMPTQLPDGLVIPCLLPRDDVRDAFFSTRGDTLDDLPEGAVVGTSSLRRQAIVLARRPDLQVVTFRGNVGTRMKKLQEGVVDATLLAVAGLNRLGQAHLIQTVLEPEVMLPAVAQGAVGIEIRADDKRMRELLEAVHCPVTELRVTAERAFLAVMDGSCRTPLAALMTEPDPQGRVRFDALVARPDGSEVESVTYMMNVTNLHEAQKLGETAGADLKKRLPEGFFTGDHKP
ncbi:MAG: hydroxymethylbilane synthase [Alphaproteobacteria bacterium]|nr:hydroxymethylbilane synthase [Alphaproteobacteria bacterium]